MSDPQCGIYFPRWSSHPRDATGCILPDGHDGRHVFQCERGKMIEWETDWECECDDCLYGEPADMCCIYTDHE